jgi:hypothetical protein
LIPPIQPPLIERKRSSILNNIEGCGFEKPHTQRKTCFTECGVSNLVGEQNYRY